MSVEKGITYLSAGDLRSTFFFFGVGGEVEGTDLSPDVSGIFQRGKFGLVRGMMGEERNPPYPVSA